MLVLREAEGLNVGQELGGVLKVEGPHQAQPLVEALPRRRGQVGK